MNINNNVCTAGNHTQSPLCLREEAEYVIETIKDYLDFSPSTESVLSAWSGIRPLVRDFSQRETETKQLSRDHVLLGKIEFAKQAYGCIYLTLLPLVSEQLAKGRSSQYRAASGRRIDKWQRRLLRKP